MNIKTPPEARPIYVVFRGRQPGIYNNTWIKCQTQVLNFPGATFQKYHNLHQGMAACDEWKRQSTPVHYFPNLVQ